MATTPGAPGLIRFTTQAQPAETMTPSGLRNSSSLSMYSRMFNQLYGINQSNYNLDATDELQMVSVSNNKF